MSSKKYSTDESSQFSQLLLEQTKGAKQIDLLVIKGHILVEYVLNKFINAFSEHNQAVEDIKFTFYQKIQICKILGLFYSKESDKLEDQVITLNKLRNEIAHGLTFKRATLERLFNYHPDVENLLDRFKPDTRDLKRLRWIIIFICGYLLGRLEGKKNVTQIFNDLKNESL